MEKNQVSIVSVAFEERKQKGTDYLSYTLRTINDVSFDVFKTRIHQAVQIYA